MPQTADGEPGWRAHAKTALLVAVAVGLVGVVYTVFSRGIAMLGSPAAGTVVGAGLATVVVAAGVALGRGNVAATGRITAYLASIVTVTVVFLALVWLVVFVLVGFALGSVLGFLAATGMAAVLGGAAALVLVGAIWDGDASTSWALNLRMVTAVLLLALCTVVALVSVWFSTFLLAALVLPALLAGFVASGVTLLLLFYTVYQEAKQAMAIESRADATPVSREEYPDLYARVTRLAKQLDIPVPTVAISERDAPEAMVVGFRPSTTHLVLSTGTLDAVDGAELDAVIAHELAHVANRDAMVMTIVSTPVVFLDSIRARLLGGITSFVDDTDHDLSEEELWGEDEEWRLSEPGPLEKRRVGILGWVLAVFTLWSSAILIDEGGNNDGMLARVLTAGVVAVLLLTWLVSRIIVAVFSRARESAADRTAAEVTGSPAAVAGALRSLDERISATPSEDLRAVSSVSSLSILPLDQELLADTGDGVPDPPAFVGRLKRRLFGTHPPVEDRLEQLARIESEQESK